MISEFSRLCCEHWDIASYKREDRKILIRWPTQRRDFGTAASALTAICACALALTGRTAQGVQLFSGAYSALSYSLDRNQYSIVKCLEAGIYDVIGHKIHQLTFSYFHSSAWADCIAYVAHKVALDILYLKISNWGEYLGVVVEGLSAGYFDRVLGAHLSIEKNNSSPFVFAGRHLLGAVCSNIPKCLLQHFYSRRSKSVQGKTLSEVMTSLFVDSAFSGFFAYTKSVEMKNVISSTTQILPQQQRRKLSLQLPEVQVCSTDGAVLFKLQNRDYIKIEPLKIKNLQHIVWKVVNNDGSTFLWNGPIKP